MYDVEMVYNSTLDFYTDPHDAPEHDEFHHSYSIVNLYNHAV